MSEHVERLIHDWNVTGGQPSQPPGLIVELDDETLRDGLQSPSVTDPTIDEKIRILHFMNTLGINNADIGLPGAGSHVQKTVEILAREIVASKLSITPSAAGRTDEDDIRPIIDVSQRVGIAIEADLFMMSSPVRQLAEAKDIDWLVKQSAAAVRFAVSHGLPVMYVTEDTTRARPEDLEKLYTAAIDAGATRICVADTVGHSTPWGVRSLIHFIRDVVARANPAVKIDWHGHEDRGLGVINSIAALEAGVDRVHGSAGGIGERVGNTPIDLLMVNLHLMGWIDRDLTQLGDYVKFVAEVVQLPVPVQYPVFGRDAFRTATGVHAAAIIKARQIGSGLADYVYSGVPAGMFGLEQIIEVGPVSGRSNAVYWLAAHGYSPIASLASEIIRVAKTKSKVLTDAELHACAKHWSESQPAGTEES